MKKSPYIRVKPENVITVWQCKKCKATERLDTGQIENSGIPYCLKCDDEMWFCYTLVKKTSVRIKKFPIEITLTNRGDIHATIGKGKWGHGDTAALAIGDMVLTHPEAFGVKYNDKTK